MFKVKNKSQNWFLNKKELKERRRLPMGVKEFNDWSDRIIKEAAIPADVESQKFALADMILHLGPSESYKEDLHFVLYLQKVAVNQVADSVRKNLQEKIKKRIEEEEKTKAVPPSNGAHAVKILADQIV